MGAVTSLFLRKVIRTAGNAVDGPALLRSVGLDPADRGDVSVMIEAEAYYGVLEQIAAELPEPADLPLRVGASMRCDDYGAFGLAWKSAPTLRCSFARAERYWRLLTSVTQYELRRDGETALFLMHRAGARRPGLCLSNEASLASVVSIIREVATEPFAPCEVHFRHPPLGAIRAHSAYFGCAVVFASEFDGLVLPATSLQTANRLGDEGISRFLDVHLDAELSRVTADLRLEGQVRDAIIASLTDGVPRAAAIARRLGLSERTLQRRLSEDGISFQALLDTTRRELAEGLLVRSTYNLAEVAFLTGFSEQSAFSRAFRRWHGTTPAVYRAEARPGPQAQR